MRTLFGEQTRQHLLRLASVTSLALALAAGLRGGDGRWVDLFPIGIVGLLAAAWLKPLVYSRLDQFVQKHTRLTPKWFAAIGGAVLLAGMASYLATQLVSRLTHSQDLPLSIWLTDLLVSMAFISLIYAFTSPGFSGNDTPQRQEWQAFAVFFLAGLGLAWKALPYPMTWDDLHLIRAFSAEELLNAFRGNWDPDHIETHGYRPLTILFNHFRYVLFQENVVAQRIFLVGLYAAFLTRTAGIAVRFGMAWAFAVLGGLLAVAARHSMYHYVWLSDGIHLLQGLLVVETLYLLVRGIGTRRAAYFVFAAFFGLAALLVREDSLILIPLGFFLAVVSVKHLRAPVSVSRKAYALCAALALMAVWYYLARSQFVPAAQSVGFDLTGLLSVAELSALGFMGQQGFDSVSRLLIGAWPLLLGACALLLANLLRSRSGWRAPLLWLAAAAIACLVGLANQRVNLLLFTITCFAFSLSALFAEYVANSRAWRAGVSAVALVILLGSAYISQVAAEAFHPSAANVVFWNAELIYGQFAEVATIPPERFRDTAQRLAAFGIRADNVPVSYYSYLDAGSSDAFSKLMREALGNSQQRPAADGRFFVPLVEPFTP